MNTLNTMGYLFLMLHVRLHNLSEIKSKVALYTCYGSGPNFSQFQFSVWDFGNESQTWGSSKTHYEYTLAHYEYALGGE